MHMGAKHHRLEVLVCRQAHSYSLHNCIPPHPTLRLRDQEHWCPLKAAQEDSLNTMIEGGDVYSQGSSMDLYSVVVLRNNTYLWVGVTRKISGKLKAATVSPTIASRIGSSCWQS